jgi:phosphatidylinositol alpha-1,6-mannosyltransferase
MSASRRHRLRVFLVGTEFFRSYGGIQYVNKLLVRAFCAIGSRTPMDLEVFSYTDGPEHFPPAHCGDSVVRWYGARRRRGAMALQLAKRLPVARPDMVLFTHVSLLPLEEAVRRLAPEARVAALAHGTEVWQPLEGRVARVVPRVNSWVCPSAFTAQKLVEAQGIDRAKIAVLAHGLDPDWTVESAATGAEAALPERTGGRLLSVTRLSRADREGKGIELVLRALPAVLERFPGVHYTVVGGGGDLPQMAELIRKLGLETRAELTGARQADALKHAYEEADVFVLPTQVEGFGVVFLEAMHSCLPVVAVRAAATPEVVEDGATGILVPPGDSRELAAALIALFSDSERRRVMGEAGRRRVAAMYCFEHFAARWELWLAAQAPEALYAARQTVAYMPASAAAVAD